MGSPSHRIAHRRSPVSNLSEMAAASDDVKPLDLGTIPQVRHDADTAQDVAGTVNVEGVAETRTTTTTTTSTTIALQTGLVYSAVMMLHSYPTSTNGTEDAHPEAPERISTAFIVLKENGCTKRMKRIQPREVLKDEVALVHDGGIWEGVYRSQCK